MLNEQGKSCSICIYLQKQTRNPGLELLCLDLHENTRWHDEAVERFDCACVWFMDIDDALVGANLELLA